MMFDAEYFNTHIYQQIEQLGAGSTTTEVHLRDGTVYRVRKLGDVHSGYVLLEVYPTEGAGPDSRERRKKPGGTEEVFYDRLAVPYDQITKVLLTITEPTDDNLPQSIDTTSINIGSMTNSAVQVNSAAASQSVVATIHNIHAVEAVLGEVLSAIDQLGLDESNRRNLVADVDTAKAQLTKQTPNTSVLKACLSSIRTTLEGAVVAAAAGGSAALANELIAKISAILGG